MLVKGATDDKEMNWNKMKFIWYDRVICRKWFFDHNSINWKFQLVAYLDEQSFITPDQFAYLKGHSTQTSLHRVIDDWLENVNESQITGICMLDIAKCFDTIDHDLLLKKLSLYGIKNIELEWFKSYLHQRQQAVLCNGKLSSFVDISSGVPQGSVLGPFLFISFINDISNLAANGCLINLFADDTIIYTSGDSIGGVQSKLQTCLDNICNWYNRNRLVINIEKSKVMIIGSTWQLKSLDFDDFVINYNDTPLELVERDKYLGIFINSDISWDFHIQNLCKQMHYLLSLLRRLRAILPQNLLLQVYKSYLQPKLDYGLTIYGCTTQENLTLVQRLQNHAARLILGNFDYINFRGIKLVKSLGLYTIEERRDSFLATLMFKSIHGLAPAYLCNQAVMNFDVNGYDTRGTDNMNVYLPKLKKDIYKNSFLYKGAQVWNCLQDVVKDSHNLEAFKYYYKLQKSVNDTWILCYCIIFFLQWKD